MALQSRNQLYRGLLKNLPNATVSGVGEVAWTTDSHGLYVSDGVSYVRIAPDNQVWSVTDAASLRTLVQAAGGQALVGDFALDTSENAYLLIAFANTTWQPSHAFDLGDTLIDSHGNLQTVTAVTGSSGGSEPVWATTGNTADSGVTWIKGSGWVQIASAGGGGSSTLDFSQIFMLMGG